MLIILFFLACLVAGGVNLFKGNFADSGLALGFCAALSLFAFWVGKEKRLALEFLNWIKSKQDDLNKGWTFYNNQKITLKTEVTQYQGCLSLILFTSRFRSRFFIVGQGSTATWLLFTSITFVFGWWGFPFGLIFTPAALYRNLRGGHHQTVGTILANIDAEIEKLSPPKRHKIGDIISEAKAEARA